MLPAPSPCGGGRTARQREASESVGAHDGIDRRHRARRGRRSGGRRADRGAFAVGALRRNQRRLRTLRDARRRARHVRRHRARRGLRRGQRRRDRPARRARGHRVRAAAATSRNRARRSPRRGLSGRQHERHVYRDRRGRARDVSERIVVGFGQLHARLACRARLAGVPGVQLDSFANAIVRGGKVQDTVFDYDSVPVPQGLIAEPGGNIVGAQLGTTGVGATTLTLSGFTDSSQNALGGVVNEIPAIGTYPARGAFQLAVGAGAQYGEVQAAERVGDARPPLALRARDVRRNGLLPVRRRRYVLSRRDRHVRPRAADASGIVVVGERSLPSRPARRFLGDAALGRRDVRSVRHAVRGARNGRRSTRARRRFPGQPADPNAQVETPSRARGTYFVGKLQWLHDWRHSLGRVYVYRSQTNAVANGPYWDDLSFPDGVISLWSQQSQRQDGIGYDFEDQAG